MLAALPSASARGVAGFGAAAALRHHGGAASCRARWPASRMIAHLRFPLGHRRPIRTTNLLERLFGEERRRTKVIPHAFDERAVLKLIYTALIRAAERWRGVRITAFEQRQMRATRDEIDKTSSPACTGDLRAHSDDVGRSGGALACWR